MKLFNITSDRFDGAVLVEYNTAGLLVSFKVEQGVTANEKAHLWLIQRIPLCIQDIEAFKAKDFIKVTEVKPDLSFDRWFGLYNYPISRKRSEEIWNRLTESDHIMAIEQAPIYEKWRLMKGYDKAYPDSYLRKRRFTDKLIFA